jgi:hypothetical protein
MLWRKPPSATRQVVHLFPRFIFARETKVAEIILILSVFRAIVNHHDALRCPRSRDLSGMVGEEGVIHTDKLCNCRAGTVEPVDFIAYVSRADSLGQLLDSTWITE